MSSGRSLCVLKALIGTLPASVSRLAIPRLDIRVGEPGSVSPVTSLVVASRTKIRELLRDTDDVISLHPNLQDVSVKIRLLFRTSKTPDDAHDVELIRRQWPKLNDKSPNALQVEIIYDDGDMANVHGMHDVDFSSDYLYVNISDNLT